VSKLTGPSLRYRAHEQLRIRWRRIGNRSSVEVPATVWPAGGNAGDDSSCLRQGKQQGWDRLENAVEQALSLGCSDAAAVRHLLSFGELAHSPVESCEVDSGLERYQRPLPVMVSPSLRRDRNRRRYLEPSCL